LYRVLGVDNRKRASNPTDTTNTFGAMTAIIQRYSSYQLNGLERMDVNHHCQRPVNMTIDSIDKFCRLLDLQHTV